MKIDNSSVKRIFVVAIVATIALGIVCGVLWLSMREDEEIIAARASALRAAKVDVVELLSYQHTTLDRDLDRALAHTTGDFREEFRRLTREVIGPAATAQRIITRARVRAAGVIDGDTDRVRVLLFVNQETTGKGQTDPKLDGSRVRVVMQRVGERWLISDLTPV